ncbi:MAG: PRTRC system protein C [Anaerolineae bacterium]
MARIFRYDNREFPDPDATLSVDEVRQQLSAFFPELVNAETREERRGETTVYTFSKRIGTKGVAVVEILCHVPETRLQVFELAAELIDADGELDVDAAGMRQPEINLAIAEAEAYAKATRQAVGALQRLLDP